MTVYYNVVIQHVSHCAKRTPLCCSCRFISLKKILFNRSSTYPRQDHNGTTITTCLISFTPHRWRHRILRHCSRNTTNGHTSPIPLYHLSRLRAKIRENGFELTKKRSRRYPAKTITDADYAKDIAIQANTTKPKQYCIVRSRCIHWPPCQCTQNRIYVL